MTPADPLTGAPVPRNGGRREGAGRKSKDVEAAAKQAAEEAGYLDYATARAHKENYLAKLAELEFEVKSGAKVDRESVREAAASAMAACAQALRAIPDTLERKHAVPAALAAKIGELIDAATDALADELERMGRDGF